MEKRGKDIGKLKALISLLVAQKEIPKRYKNHPLKGNWVKYWDAHIEPDWLLIYATETNTIRFERTGKHSDLFED